MAVDITMKHFFIDLGPGKNDTTRDITDDEKGKHNKKPYVDIVDLG